ncbi:autotransporter assembly complex protein TamB [Pantoea allii]|uniref:autotransporter assembly complex protein TamB n=1 Tax=Pantoea allii TaxID=574096 RepID=UPI000A242F57|nr:translocation/assembly module TamB domain-containing protein [Pantoea allii]MBW1252026.1 translocation/assembly module TamB [Pantoea allii]MBW1263863.1 translocation/assembly module TamB [Pantoea allii]MBW1286309.1 translocation/assembly module TamB [Pantoea allii]ORM85349.1 translocation and assembly module TamB [Pantoea allii]PBK00905.1 translocation and assembly module TamB [Pantoea allii]
MKRWKKVLIGFLIFLVLLFAGLAFLIGTTPGLHLVLNGASRWVPGLSINKVDGGWRNLTLSGLRYEMPGVSVNAGTIHLAVDLNCLLHSSVCVNDLTLKDISVVVDSKKMTPSTAPPEEESGTSNLSTPYPISLRHVGLHNISVKVDESAISLADFTTGLQWQDRALTLNPTHIQSLLIALPKAAQVAKEQVVQPKVQQPQPDEKPLGETLQALFAKPLLPAQPDFQLPLDIDVQEILGEQLRITGDTDISVSRLRVKAKTLDRHMQLQTLEVDSNLGKLNGAGQATLADNWPVDFALNGEVNVDPVKGEKLSLTLKGAMRDELKLALNLSGPVRAQLDASAQPAVAGLPLALNLTSPQLRWPLAGAIQYQADNLNYQFKGKATDYVMSLRTSVKGESVPPATVALDGKGNVQQFSLDKLRVAALQGNIDLTALVDWSKAISWRSELTLDGINTARQYPDWPAKLDGKITTRGSLYGGSWQVSVPQLMLKGNVKQNAVSADGTLRGNSYNQWDIPGIKIALGRNHLDVKGSLADTLNLDASVDAPHLDNALPGLGGVVKGDIKARGTLKAPQLLADLTATGLRWQQLLVRRITLKSDVRSSEQIAGKLQLRVEQLTQDALNISLLTLNADGDEKQHQLKLNVQGKPVSGQLALTGSFDRQTEQWKGNLNNTRFDTPVGEWRLTRAMAIDYVNQKQTATIGPHCWQNPNAQLCVPEPIEAGPDGHAHVVLNRFDLAMLKPFLTNQTQLSGVFSGDARVNWTADGKLPTGSLALKGNGVKVAQDVQGNTLPVAFNTLNINAALRDGRAQLDWLIRIVNNGQLDGNVQITDPQQRRTLGGNVNIRNISLAIINPALMQGESIKGNLNSNLRLGGTAQQPQVFGQLGLKDVNVKGNFMPVDLTRASLNMVFNGMSSTLNGLLQTAQGNINLTGDADWSQLDNWRARVAAKGSRVRVTVPPMVRMDVSPDVVFEATPAAFNLDGRVDIPWARITVQEVPESAVGVSSDEVMLDKNLKPIEPQTASIPINSNLIIHVGNDVRLSAFGLKARLNGDLKMVQDKSGLGLNGQINIPSGRFHAYGQDLIVRKGELQFAGPPDQPYINLEAIRNPDATEDSVTAGLRVTGLADEPKVEVFSDPAMSQQEALSYLLRGQGLKSDGDGNALTSALVGLGVAQSGQVVGKIGETFGVSNLALDTTGVGDSQQVQVSGYVLPGLQVKYGVGIFDSLATLTLRYRLMPKLYLEAVSGVDQALDLLYQFEF